TPPRVIKNSNLPPPPPLPANAPEVDRIAYEKAVKNYKKGNPGLVYDHMMEDGELVEIIVIEDENNVAPPPPPKNPITHMQELAVRGATFYLNGDPVSSEKAIQLVKKNKNINIDIRGVDSVAPVVKITTKTKGN
ncbi:MAG: bla regulator protein BlaR1, partial [Candidatus Paceibacteria bacterium]